MPDYQQLVKAKEDAETRLRAIPGVHAVGISKKSVRGKSADEVAIAVFLAKKKPLGRLSPEDEIPPEIETQLIEGLTKRSIAFRSSRQPPFWP